MTSTTTGPRNEAPSTPTNPAELAAALSALKVHSETIKRKEQDGSNDESYITASKETMRIMEKYQATPVIQMTACRNLSGLVYLWRAPVISSMVEAGMVPLVSTAMKTHLSHADVQFEGVRVLLNLTAPAIEWHGGDEEAWCCRFAVGDVIPTVVASVRAHPKNEELHSASFLICCMMSQEMLVSSFITEGIVPLLLESIRFHSESADLQQSAYRAILPLCRDNGAQKDLAAAVPFILSSMEKFLDKENNDHTKVQAFGCGALRNLCVRNPANQRLISDAGGLLLAQRALRLFSHDSDVMQHAPPCVKLLSLPLPSLAVLLEEKPQLLRNAVEIEAISLIHDALRHHPRNETTQRCGLELLVSFSMLNLAAALLIRDFLPLIVDTLRVHRREPMIQASGICLCINLCEVLRVPCQQEFAENGMIPHIVDSMSLHANLSQVQRLSCQAFANLARENHFNQNAIVKAGALPLILACMKNHQGDGDVQGMACLALRNLCVENEINEKMIAKSGARLAVAKAYRLHSTTNDGVQDNGSWCMEVLGAPRCCDLLG